MHPSIINSEFNKTIAPWLGKTSKMLNMYILDVFNKNNIQLTKQQWVVLKILHEDTNGIIQNDLACITERNKASLTRLINVMEKNNLVTRIPFKADSRKNVIQITKKGDELFLKTKPLLLNSLDIIQCGITENEMKDLISILAKIQNNLKKHTI
ncbi:MarR family winged helix-turn-helix transcriptional regulator [Lutibacter flavus]|uniref:DNA-binding transcriptional regulator, MarR family n=1 Tax=Lutibacter flavus TaxID=691689 RepID=A0A238VJ04_9FLAO|nr:MarR family transcriptional regulator [Lutibacter flavus]SNR33693.1 DNA-binding transcriptional regulator, MarR family [Lutibacter flavus]